MTTPKKNKKTIKKESKMVDVDKDIMILGNGKKLSLVPQSKMPLNREQILTIFQRTPTNHIFTRPGKGGGKFEYVTGTYVKKVLNYVFGFNWDFEILDEEEKYGQIVVKGKLTVRDGSGQSVIKTQYGRADIKFRKGTKTALDYGNDKKAAATDALKKASSELGIASDIYGKNEFIDLGVKINGNESKAKPTPKTSSRPNVVQIQGPQQGTLIPTNNVDYCKKLIDYVINTYDSVSEKEIVSFINHTLGTKHPKSLLTNKALSQKVLAQMMQ